ncbi:hypothetical protein ACFL7M_12945 [Thermodesulfobacteriota bacterium]
MTDGEGAKSKKDRESSIRWQARTIEQLGYALNLILGLSVAAIGFEISLILNKEFERAGWQNWLFAISMLSLLLSIAVGLWCVVNRLRDFRATTKTARKREDGKSDLDLQPLRTLTRDLGKRTWLLFWWQISTFTKHRCQAYTVYTSVL